MSAAAPASPDPAPDPQPAPSPDPTPAPAPEPKPAPTGAWHESLSEGVRTSPLFEQIRGKPSITDAFEALAKEHANVQDLIGRKGVILPKEGDAEDRQRFFKALGRPDEPSGYDLKGIDVPESLPIDQNVALGMIHDLHELGLNNEQVRGALSGYITRQSQALEAALGSIQEREEAVASDYKTRWGAKHDENWTIARNAFIQRAGSPEKFAEIANTRLADGTMLGSHPFIIDLFLDIGSGRLELPVPGEREPAGGFSDTPEAAKSKLAELMGDAENQKILGDEQHPMHKALVERKSRLYAMAYPNRRGERGEREQSA